MPVYATKSNVLSSNSLSFDDSRTRYDWSTTCIISIVYGSPSAEKAITVIRPSDEMTRDWDPTVESLSCICVNCRALDINISVFANSSWEWHRVCKNFVGKTCSVYIRAISVLLIYVKCFINRIWIIALVSEYITQHHGCNYSHLPEIEPSCHHIEAETK